MREPDRGIKKYLSTSARAAVARLANGRIVQHDAPVRGDRPEAHLWRARYGQLPRHHHAERAAERGGKRHADRHASSRKPEDDGARVGSRADELDEGEALRLTIKEGWHVNSNAPAGYDLVGTTVSLESDGPVKLRETVYPEDRKTTLGSSPEPLSI